MAANSSRAPLEEILDGQDNQSGGINSTSGASNSALTSMILPGGFNYPGPDGTSVRLDAIAIVSQIQNLESRVRALETNNTSLDTIHSPDVAAIIAQDDNYASQGLPPAAQRMQTDDVEFEAFTNISLASEEQRLTVAPNMLSLVGPQDIPPAPSSLPSVSTPSTSVNAVAPAAPRFRCATCRDTFSRLQNLRRHERERKHNPNATRYPCPRQDCVRSGLNGFPRRDRLRDHRATYGH
ncbi:hypothetical protein L207DRAFT_627857 [Hyaloscypha variabilis F]|uniref:C2H2-type domain-containing protein n=1 Tax=Hyaloscypha variabilis (strain UAMH 11265 / GT02V1 / F) TaxID=1149755 RepID=A0A2J6S8Q9_HYAVF|nr:hypothetical protein L207DRAFT_627857 [Hyaloscypha variabilis F]